MDHVVIDVEIQKTIEETPGGWDATDKLGLAVACLWEYSTGRMRIYGKDDVEALQNRLLQADRISGYNIFNFDFPVIWGHSKPAWKALTADESSVKAKLAAKTDDMLRRIWKALNLDPDDFSRSHAGWKLDDVAGNTLHVRKIGFGGDAPKWYQAGEVIRVANYCSDDVAIERDLTDFVERYGYVLNGIRKLIIPPWGL